jgi:hypothetical protein
LVRLWCSQIIISTPNYTTPHPIVAYISCLRAHFFLPAKNICPLCSPLLLLEQNSFM